MSGVHVLVHPFPQSSHIIPILDLTHLLLTRGLTVTILIEPTDFPLLEPFISTHNSSSIQPLLLSRPTPTQVSFATHLRTMSQLFDPVVKWFKSSPSPPVAIISDFLLGWTQMLATHLGIQRVIFCTSGAFECSIFHSDLLDPPAPGDKNSLLSYPKIPNSPVFPWWQLSNLSQYFIKGDPDWEFFRECMLANLVSWGMVFNSFSELERVYLDHVKTDMGYDRVWAVGPLLPSEDPTARGVPSHELMTWLDEKSDNSVVYICFGSRVTLTAEQMSVLVAALECSKVHFILCVKAVAKGHAASDADLILDGLEDRVEGRGFISKGWAPQVAILSHRAVSVFLTHCGWNSVLEGLKAGVLLLTWPRDADQFINARLLVDELGVAIRVCEGGKESVPNSTELGQLLDESVNGSMPERARVMELSDAAFKAVNGGSSSKDLDMLVKHLNEL